ncbi:hypothetical protein CAOG_03472 [Capsaspora owczarzaki ATCC 30864]|uniref:Major facilitator superfamily (MFS) profile domain-containing protein n=1 Tax=Capsaspora owczarzaki (strain ATCC 30864) TaxID=595528 RepID=A0A0D2WN96_CAPO3|nr:hypothetical protein CAOG_03472 [Capsaspora owczarzaki ATCC 30864]KJE92520.1 hypothetical protein CAOG_003472 [Capsaspora owczarzaki ATCC 30864]|eukprot:XP_004348377.2 hypothetical protein CAOG_03472 [Capsaspora owczarzaki ATCC 30864]
MSETRPLLDKSSRASSLASQPSNGSFAKPPLVGPPSIHGGSFAAPPDTSKSQAPPQCHVYKRRWYILFIFSVASFMQSMVWLTYNSVNDQTKEYYNNTIDDSQVVLFLTWGPVFYIPVVMVVPYLEKRLGPKRSCRVIVLAAAGLTAAGSVIRLIPCWFSVLREEYWRYIFFVTIGQILNACSGPFVMASPSKLSVTWFAPNERTFATALFIVCNNLGTAVGMLVGPYIAPTASDVPLLLYINAGLSVLTFVVILAYFPAAPPLPPTPLLLAHPVEATEAAIVAMGPHISTHGVLHLQQHPTEYDAAYLESSLTSASPSYSTTRLPSHSQHSNHPSNNLGHGQQQSLSHWPALSSSTSESSRSRSPSPSLASVAASIPHVDDPSDQDELLFSRGVQPDSPSVASFSAVSMKGPVHKLPMSLEALTPEWAHRLTFGQTVAMSVKSSSFMLLAICGGVQAGIFNGWTNILPTIIKSGANELSFYSQLAGIVAALIAGKLCDTLLKRRFKIVIVVLFCLGIGCLVWFTLSFPVGDTSAVINSSYLANGFSISLAGFFFGGCNPLFYELAAEITYPLSEDLTAGILTLFNNLGCILMLLVTAYVDADDINTFATCGFVACLLPLVFVKERYRRLNAEEARLKTK